VIGVVVYWTVPHRPESVFHLHRVKNSNTFDAIRVYKSHHFIYARNGVYVPPLGVYKCVTYIYIYNGVFVPPLDLYMT
ncbi:hypothetical protein Taro_011956, partial [Colocasia esculenta]|nr:hypothetical protein [Colocasia esculenta]